MSTWPPATSSAIARLEVADAVPSTKGLFVSKAVKERAALMEKRKDYRVGIPRLLNTYTYAPMFNAYFASLGLKAENIVYSDYTTPELYRAGASRGAIDPCYPSKIGIAHVYNLLATKHAKSRSMRSGSRCTTCCTPTW